MKQIQIAIDGPASSGKSTVAKIIAKDFNYTYLDTGAMYRAATYLALRNHLTENDATEIVELLETYSVSFGRADNGEQLVFVGDVDVTHPIRENDVTNNVSGGGGIGDGCQRCFVEARKCWRHLLSGGRGEATGGRKPPTAISGAISAKRSSIINVI